MEKYQLDTLFSHIFVTGDIGFLKSEEALYQHVWKRLNAVSDQCVFIDNQRKNLETPQRLGMDVIHHESYRETWGDLKRKLENILTC